MNTPEKPPLPPGQYEIERFPRFGLPPFAERFPRDTEQINIQIGGDVQKATSLGPFFPGVERVEQCCDFHCVTTWTRRSLQWSGFRFADVYRQVIVPLVAPLPGATFVVLRGLDGYRSSLSLADLLAPDVLLADRLHGEPLSIAHGAPLRLIAPAHYGYKSVKHLSRIEFLQNAVQYHPVGFRFMAHPRARVANEERGQWVPGWLLRYLYRPFVRPAARRFEEALARHMKKANREV